VNWLDALVVKFLAEFLLRPDHVFVCGDPVFKAFGCEVLGQDLCRYLGKKNSLPICKTFVAEHVQGSDLELGRLDLYWCLGSLIFAAGLVSFCGQHQEW
jgi:hypothetical protein